MPRLIAACSLVAFLGAASCTTGVSAMPTPESSAAPPMQSPLFSPPAHESPLPPEVSAWNSYSSIEYGYSLRYPPNWLDLGNGGASDDQRYFSNRQDFDPLRMNGSDLDLLVDANCQYFAANGLINQADVVVGGVAAVRYVVVTNATGTSPIAAAIVTVKPGAFCYRIAMIARTLLLYRRTLPISISFSPAFASRHARSRDTSRDPLPTR